MPRAHRAEPTAAEEGPALHGIAAVRRSLGFGAEDEALLERLGEHVGAHIEGWVDGFHRRMLADPVGAPLLADDGARLRARRSMIAWFQELFSLPHDESYQSTRAGIGQAHVRIGMPQYLMVTAMSGLRRDVLTTLESEIDAPEKAAMRLAVERVLDLELALMLEAYRREARALARRQGRAVFAEQAARRILRTMRDRVDAALCYVEMAMAAEDVERTEALVRVRDILRAMSGPAAALRPATVGEGPPARRVRVRDLCARAVDNVNLGPGARIEISILPTELELALHAEAVGLALEELFHNAMTHAPATTVRLVVHALASDTAIFEVMDEGPGWGAGIRQVEDLHALGNGIGLALCELVASMHRGRLELFEPPAGGAGVRLTLRDVSEGSGDGDDLPAHP